MSLHTSTTRRKAQWGTYRAACAVCGAWGSAVDMEYLVNTAPGGGTIRSLVHPRCNFEARKPEFRPKRHRTPDLVQPGTEQFENALNTITVTSIVWAVSGTTTATIADIGAARLINVVGTGFTASCRGVIDAGYVRPKDRTTTFNSTTSLDITLDADDIVAGTISMGVVRYPDSTAGRFFARDTFTLTITDP